MKRKWLLALALLLLGLGGLAFYSARLLFSDSLQTARGTYAYWLCISAIIKNVPEVRVQRPADFYYSAGDGPKPPESSVTYGSQGSPDEVRAAIAEYLIKNGYQRRGPDEFIKSHSIVSVTATPDSRAGLSVTVSEVF